MKRLSILLIALVASFCLFSNEAALAACGCTQMTVSTFGNQTICSDNKMDMRRFKECTRTNGGLNTVCPNNTYVYNCPTGVNSQQLSRAPYYQRTGLKITATYTNGSTATDCTPGQILQETLTSNMVVQKPNINPTSLGGNQNIGGLNLRIDNNPHNEFPDVGQTSGQRQDFGGDNYIRTATDVISSNSASGAQWWDNTDQTKHKKKEDATWAYRFISFVRGSAGQPSCSCVTNIGVTWKPGKNPATNISRATTAPGSQRCS